MGFRFVTLGREDLLRLISFFLMGLILGGVGVNILFSRKLDSLILEKEDLMEELKTQEQRLNTLEQSLRSHELRLLQGVEVNLSNDFDRYLLRSVEAEIKDIFYPFVGRSLEELDPLSLALLIDDRIFSIDGKNLQADLRVLTLQETLGIYIEVSETQPDN